MSTATNFIDVLEQHAAACGNQIVYQFLDNGEQVSQTITYAALAQRARAAASALQQHGKRADRVLLLYPSCIEYMVGFFACLYAGMAAVPIFPPRSGKHNGRLESVLADCDPIVGLTTLKQKQDMRRAFEASEALTALPMLCSDEVPMEEASAFRPIPVDGDVLAFLQYTSGATGQPKGVMVSHGNLIYNERMIQQGFGTTKDSQYVTWLPIHHDMGLIGQMLHSVWLGTTCTFMSPGSFLRRPACWLEAISRFRADVSGAPNFAYDLCVDKIADAQCVGLDLSTWRVAFNGAEPVRHSTLERFARRFAPFGFRRQASYPCYGMAEATLIVSGGVPEAEPVCRWTDKEALGRGMAEFRVSGDSCVVAQVGCGVSLLEQQVRIVNPRSHAVCADGEVGEIWIRGRNVGSGYWNKLELSREVFQAHLSDGDGPYLRTGDLGYLSGGELFITGRLKDVIIVRGVNHYPQDIEQTIGVADEAIARNGAAAFGVDMNGERVVAVVEVERNHLRKVDVATLCGKIRQAVIEIHEVSLADVVLIRPGTLPRTSSGKVQRGRCRELYLAKALDYVDSAVRGANEAIAL